MENYINRKSKEKLDFLEKMAAWMSQHATAFRQQSNAKSNKRKKQMDEEEKENDAMPEVHRQPLAHQKPVGKVEPDKAAMRSPQGSSCQHNVSTLTQSQNRQSATKQGAHQTRDVTAATTIPTHQALINQADDQIQEEISCMQAADQDQDILAQAMAQGNVPMSVDLASNELLSEDTLSSMNLLGSVVLKLNSSV